jgi:3-phenylpropionate/cinnamic acid dioxygenase small subunit
VLNQLGVTPDPDEVDTLYFGHHRRMGQQAAILAQLQLHARTGTKVELRQLARLAGISNGDPSTACRVVRRLQALGALQVLGGERLRDTEGRVRRSCQSYRLQYAAGQPIKAERALLARLYVWAVDAGVDEREARSCSRQGHAGADRLLRLVRIQALQQDARQRRARVERQDHRQEARQRGGGVASAASVVDELRARLEDRRSQVQHGDSNSETPSQRPKRNGSWVGISHGEIPTYSALAHVRTLTPDEEQADFDVVAYAEKIGSRLPWLDGRTVLAEARRRSIPVWKAAREYVEFAGDALDHQRAGRVRKPAAWAMSAFKARMAAL